MYFAITASLDYQLSAPADLLLALEVAQLADQRLVSDKLTLWGTGPLTPVAAEEGVGRRTWASGAGRITAHYTALVEIDRPVIAMAGLPISPKHRLPAEVIGYLWPSRYCDSDRFENFVARSFGHLTGGDKVLAIAAWIATHIEYLPGVSDSRTSASDTYLQRQGVCRDFAHLLIAMVRAADIPARMVGAYGWRVTPQDFHAVAEVWLDGAWHLVDASGLARPEHIIRIGVGRDATDVSFLTIFGHGGLIAQAVTVESVPAPEPAQGA
ncbi:transglutaminase family protein [Sphingomonas sp. IC-56]|uniref:transglutaminase-like domain-containing protein n=1 Tax=Sphingomonas sp. IC-56 TaxID=2898529 RepID=UPI001E30E87E|nr:transglutaminase family protein [Sphingomonas sp. IC-56]